MDTQNDRFECHVLGWGLGREVFVVEYKIIYGDPNEEEMQDKLDVFLNKTYFHRAGQMRIVCSAIDVKGHKTDAVYEFVKSREVRNIYTVQGGSQPALPVEGKSSMSKAGTFLFTVDKQLNRAA